MTRTYVKGRISRDKRREYRRDKSHYKCHCCNSGINDRTKGWKKTEERNKILSIINGYYSIKIKLYTIKTMRWLIPMME